MQMMGKWQGYTQTVEVANEEAVMTRFASHSAFGVMLACFCVAGVGRLAVWGQQRQYIWGSVRERTGETAVFEMTTV
jgi:hypothetical protein